MNDERGLTLDKLKEIAATMPRPRIFPYAAVSRDAEQVIRAELPETTIGIAGMGNIDIYVKDGQVYPAWMFSDRKLLLDYLNGKVSERELATMAIESKGVKLPTPMG